MTTQRKFRKLISKRLVVLLIMFGVFAFCLKAQPSETQNNSMSLLTHRIDSFLSSWLIKKDSKKNLEFFSQKAFLNKEILNESCAGYIKKNERNQPNLVKKGITQFLLDFSANETNKSLNDWLNKNNKFFNEKPYGESAITLSKTTEYWLFNPNSELLKSILEDESRLPYLNKYLANKKTVILITGLNLKIESEQTIGYVYFIWSKENNNWKIVHIGMLCQ